MRVCLHWNALLFALVACTIDVCASVACAHVQLIYAESFALITFLSDVFQQVAACHTWSSSVIAVDVENCPWHAMEMELEREPWQLSLPEIRGYRGYNARSHAAHILSRGGRDCGWPSSERERRRCSEMVRTHRMVDSASCCTLQVLELLLRQRVLAEMSPAARDSSLGSRYTMNGISQRWYGLRSCRPPWITEGPCRQSPLPRRRDLAALFLLVHALLQLCGCVHLHHKDICQICQRQACLFQRVCGTARVGRGPRGRLPAGRGGGESPLLLFFCEFHSGEFHAVLVLFMNLVHIRLSCALSHLETPDELCWFCFFSRECGVRVSGNSYDIVCARSGSVTTSNSENGTVLPF